MKSTTSGPVGASLSGYLYSGLTYTGFNYTGLNYTGLNYTGLKIVLTRASEASPKTIPTPRWRQG